MREKDVPMNNIDPMKKKYLRGGEARVMNKVTKKVFNVMATAALLTGVAVPTASVVAPVSVYAAGSGTITATNVPTVADGQKASFGTIKVVVPAGTSIKDGDKVIVKLPYDMEKKGVTDTVYGDWEFGPNQPNNLDVPDKYNGDPNGFYHDSLGQLLKGKSVGSDRIEITFNSPDSDKTKPYLLKNDGVFFIQLGELVVDKGDSGPVEAVFEASSSSSFPTGSVVIGNVNSRGEVLISASSLDNVNDNFTPKINIAETVPGAFAKDGEIKIKLPNGFKWDTAIKEFNEDAINETIKFGEGEAGIVVTYGEKKEVVLSGISFDITDNGRELVIRFNDNSKTTQATKLEIPAPFYVDDESAVKPGDVIAKISGKTNTDVKELKVGTYGDYSTSVSAEDVTDIIAGKKDQEIGTIVIKESVDETLIKGRTVLLTLPEGARWNKDSLSNFDSDESIYLRWTESLTNNDRTARFVVDGTPGDAATLKLEDAEVLLDAAFSGDLKVTVSGTAGVSGEVVVAHVKKPVEAKAEGEVPNVIIGATDQKAADFTITENIAGAFGNDTETVNGSVYHKDKVVIYLPEGAKFVGTPKVEVTEGDLKIEDVKVTSYDGDSDRAITFTVDSDSSEPSTIKISGVKVQLDRTVPEGDLKVRIGGSSLVETAGIGNWAEYAAEVAIAKVATPAPVDQKTEVVFTINSTTYKVNGVEKTADVAPVIRNDRAFLPVRYVAEALGVSEDNIIWNDGNKTVTLIKGDRVVQLQVGSKNLVINGATIQMDVAAFVSGDRTFLPMRYVAQALGAEVKWDDATRTVTLISK